MRADRLISIVMLLQSRTRMTAIELSRELEVSTRTIYRDITALTLAGVPIYTDRGPGGGIALLESYRTTLTGINAEEARALFMLSIPEALVKLGVGQNLKSALFKLAAALSSTQNSMQAHTQQRIHLDSTPWIPKDEPAPHLGILHQAVWLDRIVWIRYRGSFETEIEIQLAPIGLVAKLTTWYLVGNLAGYMKVIAVRDIMKAEITEQRFIRDDDFDLEDFWKAWCQDYIQRRPVYPVRLNVSSELLTRLNYYLGETEEFTIGKPASSGPKVWTEVNLTFEHLYRARECILNMGGGAQVIEPEALRLSVVDFAHQIVDSYEAVGSI